MATYKKMEEIFKDIKNYPDYQVSQLGIVRSLKHGKIKILKGHYNYKGYKSVVLFLNGIKKSITVHQLVASVFLNHTSDGTTKIVVDHINNIKTDNRLENLQLITNRENINKSKKEGTSKHVGVHLNKHSKKWQSQVTFNGRSIYLGLFEKEIDASNIYQQALNQIDKGLDLNLIYTKRIKSSSFKGVCWSKSNKKWMARVKSKHLGYFNTEEEAYKAYLSAN